MKNIIILKEKKWILFATFSSLCMLTETFAQCSAGFTFTVSFDSVQFTNTSTSTFSGDYTWDFADNNISTLIHPLHIYQNAGSYLVCLTMEDDTAGCTDVFCDTVDITNIPPVSAAWNQKENFPTDGRQWATGFSIGNMGYVGMGWDGSNYRNDFYSYDPFTNTWTELANFPGAGRYGAVSFVIGNKAYVGLGYGGSFKNDFWEYDPATDTWTQVANFGGTSRVSAVGFSIKNKGYVGTGYDGNDRKDFWEFDPSANTWTSKTNFPGVARNAAVGFSIGNKGYIGTGHNMSASRYYDFYQYNPATNSWVAKANVGGVIRSSAVSFVLDGEGYIGLGEKSYGDSYKDFWKYDTTTNIWTKIPNFAGSTRGRAIGFSIGDYYAYVGLGENYYHDFWQYSACTVLTPSVTIGRNDTICQNDSVFLFSSDTSSNQQWYLNNTPIFGATQQSHWATQSGQYFVSSGCSSPSKAVTVTVLDNISTPSICIVTVDSSIGKNTIVWEKLSDSSIISYNIYKETTQAGVYSLIGNNPVSLLSTFVDTSSNPSQVAARYKLTSVDTCNAESEKSVNHKTIHLSISMGIAPAINLNWSNYEGIIFDKYYIWRGTLLGNLNVIDSIQSTLTSYTDLNPPVGTNFYAIQVIYSKACTPSLNMSFSYSSSFSNAESTFSISGMSDKMPSVKISVIPNPTDGYFSVNFDGTIDSMEIYSLLGNRIYSSNGMELNQKIIDISERPAGIYIISIKSGSDFFYHKLLRQ